VANPDACEEWVTALGEGGYDYAVIGPDQRTQDVSPVEALWTRAAGGSVVVESDDVFVFELPGELDDTVCARITPLSGIPSTDPDAPPRGGAIEPEGGPQ
jgi:hypothetical protein